VKEDRGSLTQETLILETLIRVTQDLLFSLGVTLPVKLMTLEGPSSRVLHLIVFNLNLCPAKKNIINLEMFLMQREC